MLLGLSCESSYAARFYNNIDGRLTLTWIATVGPDRGHVTAQVAVAPHQAIQLPARPWDDYRGNVQVHSDLSPILHCNFSVEPASSLNILKITWH
jgi:hypothetical protein